MAVINRPKESGDRSVRGRFRGSVTLGRKGGAGWFIFERSLHQAFGKDLAQKEVALPKVRKIFITEVVADVQKEFDWEAEQA